MPRVRPALAALALTIAVTAAYAAGPVGAAPLDRAPRHELTVRAKQVGPHRFLLYGRVPTDRDARVSVVRSVAGGPYHRLEKVRTSHRGHFRARIHQVSGRPTCFKVVAPATPGHRRTVSRGASCITTS